MVAFSPSYFLDAKQKETPQLSKAGAPIYSLVETREEKEGMTSVQSQLVKPGFLLPIW